MNRDRKYCSKSVLTPLVLAASVASINAQAQDQSGKFVLEEIIVTAQKREQAITDAPLTVNVFSGKDLAAANAFDFEEISKLTPGLELEPSGNRGARLTLRGNGFNDATSLQPAVTVLYDGIVQNRISSAFASLLDVASIEVLRGPQGTLYGKNSPAGAVKIITHEPNLEDYELNIEGSLESLDSNSSGAADGITGARIQASANIPLIEDKLAVRIAALSNNDDGYHYNPWLDKEAGYQDREAFQGKILWQISDSLDATLLYKQTETEKDGAAGIFDDGTFNNDPLLTVDGLIEPTDHELYVRRPGYIKEEDKLWGLTVNLELDDITISSITGYQEFEETNVFADGPGPGTNTLRTLDPGRKIFSQEIKFSASTGDFWDYVGGIYYSDEQAITDGPSREQFMDLLEQELDLIANDPDNFLGHNSPLFNSRLFSSFTLNENTATFMNFSDAYGDAGNTSFGVYFHNTFQVTDQLSFVAGARYSEDEIKSDLRITRVSSGSITTIDTIDTVKDRGWSYSLKAIYEPSDELTTYISLDRTTKPGGTTPTTPALEAVGIGKFDEESSDSFEIGAKGTGLDGRLRYSTSIYYQTYDDYQYFAFAPRVGRDLGNGILAIGNLAGSGLVQLNTEEATSYGFETDFALRVNENITVSGAYSWNKTEIEDALVPSNFDEIGHPQFAAFGTEFLCHEQVNTLAPFLGLTPPVCPASVPGFPDAASLDGFVPTITIDKEELGLAAEHSATLSAEYRDQLLGDKLEWFARVFYRYNSGREDGVQGADFLEAYDTVDLTIGLSDVEGKWKLNLWSKNIFDKDYYVSGIDDAFGNPESGSAGAPRSIGITAGYSFN